MSGLGVDTRRERPRGQCLKRLGQGPVMSCPLSPLSPSPRRPASPPSPSPRLPASPLSPQLPASAPSPSPRCPACPELGLFFNVCAPEGLPQHLSHSSGGPGRGGGGRFKGGGAYAWIPSQASWSEFPVPTEQADVHLRSCSFQRKLGSHT